MELTSLLSSIDERQLKVGILCSVPVAVATVGLINRWRRNRSLPPGPSGLPLLGCVSLNDQSKWHKQMTDIGLKYNGLFSFYFGTQLIVVVTDFHLLKEMLEGPDYAGRNQTPLVKEIFNNTGIGGSEGSNHTLHRRLSLRILRDFGFAKDASIDLVESAMDAVYCTLDDACESNQPVKLLDHFMGVSNSVIAKLVFGKSFTREDKAFAEFCETIGQFFTSPQLSVLDKYPILYHIIMRLPALFDINPIMMRLRQFVNVVAAEREVAMADENAEPTCLCDVYIQERRKAEKKGDFQTFRQHQLQSVCQDFFIAGTDTTARSVEWLMIFMAFHPDVQRRVQQELDEVVGRTRLPRLADKANLHFTCAVIDEAYRKASLAVVGVYHRATVDTVFHGYSIPKDTLILPHVFAVHHNPNYWPEPSKFRPERFLDSSGRYKSSSKLVPFLVGKRSCVGESLARVEIFAMFAALMQRYSVRPSAESETRGEEIIDGQFRLVMEPKDYRLHFSRR